MKSSTDSTPVNEQAALIERVDELLHKGRAEDALAMLGRCKSETPAIRNARGVCLLRLGRFDTAQRIFRELVYPGGKLAIPTGTPTVFQTNYVTSMLLLDNVMIAISLLYRIADQKHPAVVQLSEVIRAWKRSLPWWRRIALLIGQYPAQSLHLGFEPGHLWTPRSEKQPQDPRQAAA